MRRLITDVIELARSFASIQAVYCRPEGHTLVADVFAPDIEPEEDFELTKAMLRIENRYPDLVLDFHATWLPLDRYESAGFEIVKFRKAAR